MITPQEIIQIEKAKSAKQKPNQEELKRIPLDRPAKLFGRLSGLPQVRESLQSMAELAGLVKLARKDGFHTEITDEETEKRLSAIQRGEPGALRYWVDGQLMVDLRDLGLSGRLGPDKRPGLRELMADLIRGEASDITGTIYLSSEGVSRLSRDQDRIIGYQLLKLMKEANCRIRQPYAILNPRIEADWRELAEGFEDAAKEGKRLQEKHFGPKKREKALKGEHVGTQVPPGFIIDIMDRKSDGRCIFGKWIPYPPQAGIVIRILQEYVRQNGGEYRTAQTLGGLVFPFFPEDLAYMNTRSSLRNCLKNERGYIVTPEVIVGLARNVALIGVWKWSDIVIENNHLAIVPVDLFLEAYELAHRTGGKKKGRAVYFEPLEWDGLLFCYNHDAPLHISGRASEGAWVCDRDYHNGTGPTCLDIVHHVISQPLTKEFLRCLDLGGHAETILEELQDRSKLTGDEEARRKHEESRLRNKLANLEGYLGSSEPELEESYRRQIRKTQEELRDLQSKPLPSPVSATDIDRVKHFLENLEMHWESLSSTLRNRLLKLIIDRVEIRHDRLHFKAVVVWKMGFMQTIEIERPEARSMREWHWTEEQENLLKILWPTSSEQVILAAFPSRTWSGISCRAQKLGLARQRLYPPHWKPWTKDDDDKLATLYVTEPSLEVVAEKMERSHHSIVGRASYLKIKKPKELTYGKRPVVWEVLNFQGFEAASS